MNRYIVSQVILNVNNKNLYKCLQLTSENAIFASKSDMEKDLILSHRKSPDIYYAIKHNNMIMFKRYYQNYIFNQFTNNIDIEWKKIIDIHDSIYKFLTVKIDLIGILIVYFGNLSMLKLSLRRVWYVGLLYFAVYMNHLHIVKYLVKQMDTTNGVLKSQFLKCSVKNNNMKIFKVFYKIFKKQYHQNFYLIYTWARTEEIKSIIDDKKNGHKRMFKFIQEKNEKKMKKN